PRTIEHASRGELAQPRREFLVNETDVSEKYGEGNKSASGVIHRDKSGVGDDIKRLLAAVIGVRSPAYVGEQTGYVTQSPLLRSLFKSGRRHEAICPRDQFLAMGGQPRAQHIELACRSDQRILVALLRVESRIQQPLAHAERRDDDVL